MTFFKKLFIPSGDKQELIALENWTVRWNAILDRWGTPEQQAEVFTDEQSAKKYADALKDAFKFLRNRYNVDVDVKKTL